MSMLIAAATGNFTAAGTWKLASTVGIIDSEAASFNLSTAQQSTNTFVLTNVAHDAVLLKLGTVKQGNTPTGTVTIELFNNTGGSVALTVTVNAADLPFDGWAVLKFSSTHTPNGTDAYKIRAVRSVADSSTNRVTFCCSTASFADASRYIRRTATQAPADTDQLIMAGEMTGAGTSNSFTVTMDRTNTTDTYGPAASQINVSLCKLCTLTFGTTASTNYYFRWKGYFNLHDGGTLNVGTSGTRMPSTSTAVLEMNCAANVDSGFQAINGTLNMYGATKTVTKTRMTVDKVATNTVIVVTSTSGWANGDLLGFASTSRTASEFESKTISTVDNGTQVTLTAGLTNAHSGTSPIQAEVVNLTRNIKFRGTSGSLQGFLLFTTGAFASSSGTVTNIDYIEFVNLGSSTDNSKRGIELIGTSVTSISITNCAMRSFGATGSCGIRMNGGGTYIVSNNVFFDMANYGILIVITGFGPAQIVDNNWVIGGCSGAGISNADGNQTTLVTNCVASSTTGNGFEFLNQWRTSTPDSNIAHSCTGIGFYFNNCKPVGPQTASNITTWRNAGGGMKIDEVAGTLFDTVIAFGNQTQNVLAQGVHDSCLLALTSNGDSTFSTTNGLVINGVCQNFNVDSALFSVVAGIKTAHSVDTAFPSGGNVAIKVTLRNCNIDNPTVSALPCGSFVALQKAGQTAGNHKSIQSTGGAGIKIERDTTTFHTSSPSAKITNGFSPSMKGDSTLNNMGLGMLFNVDNGSAKTISVWVRKEAGYSGAQPRLILKANPAVGVDRDTVLATMTAGVSTWEQLSGTTPAANDDGAFECVVDFDSGTSNAINVDDWDG